MPLREKLRESFHPILRDNFRSGFDPASIIDRKKFARVFRSLHRLESFEPDEELLRVEAFRSCLQWEGKFYAIEDSAWDYIESLKENLRQAGECLINLEA